MLDPAAGGDGSCIGIQTGIRTRASDETTERWSARSFAIAVLTDKVEPSAHSGHQDSVDRMDSSALPPSLSDIPSPRRQSRLLADAAFAGAQLELMLRPLYDAIGPLMQLLRRSDVGEFLPLSNDCCAHLAQTEQALRKVEPLVTRLTRLLTASATHTVASKDLLPATTSFAELTLVPLLTTMAHVEAAQNSAAQFVRMMCDRVREAQTRWQDRALVDAFVRDFGGTSFDAAMVRATAWVASRSRVTRELAEQLRRTPQLRAAQLQQTLLGFEQQKAKIVAKLEDAATVATMQRELAAPDF